MNLSHGVTEFVAGGGVLIIALLLALASRRASSPAERMKIRAAAWSLLRDTQADSDPRREPAGSDVREDAPAAQQLVKSDV
jgi:hypothetical protein